MGAALGLYNSRIVKLINKKGQLKSGIIIDELPTIYFKGVQLHQYGMRMTQKDEE